MSEWLVLTLGMLAACAVVIVVVLLRQRRHGAEVDPSETPDVIEYMTMMIGVVYAIVLGLAIAGVWEARSTADAAVSQEAQALHEVSERVRVYPAKERERVRDDVDAYVRYTVNKEWPYMAEHGSLTDKGRRMLGKLRQNVTSYEPSTTQQAQSYQAAVDQVAEADTARTDRAASAEPTMPGVVWFGLVAGAVVSVGMLFALQIQRSGRELVLAGLFSALLAFLLFLVWHFDTPFAHGLDDSGGAFTTLFPKAAGS
ncbi:MULTISPECIES: DUF4239 domain-containing protein [unclassified Streptomyces]|uniref:bestrophin-like domain n=1 Tax=unclassified Streptomyces TaxID=2593676 RepID=UPI002DD98FB0|nr:MULTISPECIES: DUF4239 domain-containing protein [unclassified Streptomyces]WSA90474.1 DUF4239 domain-containing protein [Streptomyces sp. NBC_01795]WSS16917.1 DUF4239 domain-containing protein [Streptomyces sp. NBC_01186]WSS45661.1 DUF4239 domain-containing protein [Streptomyces sp. NBC_01187]